MTNIGPGEVLEYIETITYPATKVEIKNTALTHFATDEVLEVIDRLPDREYEDGNDVSSEVEKLNT